MVLRLAALVCLWLGLASQAIAADNPAIIEMKTPKGLRFVYNHLQDDRQQVLAFYWRDHSVEQTLPKAGLLQLSTLLIVNGGTTSLDGGALSEDVVDLDGGLALRRSPVRAFGRMVGPPENMPALSALMHDLLTKPRLPQKHLDRDRRSILNDIRANLEKPSTIANEALSRFIVGNAPQRAFLTTDPAVYTGVTVADVDAWRKSALARDNLTVVASGPAGAEAIMALADSIFGDLPAKAARHPRLDFKPHVAQKTIIIERPGEQSQLLMGGVTRWNDADQATPRAIAMTVLGGDSSSRLFVAIREKLGAAYGASASVRPLTRGYHRFSMEASVAHDKLKPAIEAMRTEYKRFREEGVTDKEVQPLLTRFITRRADMMTRSGPATDVIISSLEAGLSPKFIMDYAPRVQKITAKEISAAIRKQMPSALVTVIVTPSAQGLEADCVIKDVAEIGQCR